MSETLMIIIIIGLIFYLMHRGGGHSMGCCGVHIHHRHGEDHHPSKNEQGENKKRHQYEYYH